MQMRQRLSLLGLFSAFLLIASACTAPTSPTGEGQPAAPDQPKPAAPDQPKPAAKTEPKYGGVLHTQKPEDPPSYNLYRETTVNTNNTMSSAYDQLVRFDRLQPDKIVPELAERWEVSPDGKTFTFSLVKGVKFHNGNPLTAADVKFTMESWVVSPLPKGERNPRLGAYTAIERVETPDDFTVKLHLKYPNPSLLDNLAQGWNPIYDREFIEQNGGTEVMQKQAMGTGPYKLKEHQRGVSVEMAKNPDYWVKGRPYLNGLKFFVIRDPNTYRAAVRTAQLHLGGGDKEYRSELAKEIAEGKYIVKRVGSYSMQVLGLNTTRPPLDDPRVRQAISLGIDRKEFIRLYYEGEADIGGYLAPSGKWKLPDEELLKLPGYGTDRAANQAKAKELLAQAGFPSGFKARLVTRSTQGYVDLAVVVQGLLQKIGIDAEVAPQEAAMAFETRQKGDFDMLPWTLVGSLDDPDHVYGQWYICNAGANFSRLCDKDLDALFEKQSQTLDPKERQKVVWEMEKKAVSNAGFVMLSWGWQQAGYWAFVKNYEPHPSIYNNWQMRDVWLDQ